MPTKELHPTLKWTCLPSLISTVSLLNAGWDACCIYNKYPYCCHKRLGICLLDCGRAVSSGIWKLQYSSHCTLHTYAAALSATRHSLQSDWLINELLAHQRQQPVGSSIPYLETLIRNCSEWSIESGELKWKNRRGGNRRSFQGLAANTANTLNCWFEVLNFLWFIPFCSPKSRQ